LIFFNQIGHRKFYGIAHFFIGILGVVLQGQADPIAVFIDKRPFPGNQNMKRITAVIVRFTVFLFDLFEKIFKKLFARIFILQFNPDDMTRRRAGGISNLAAFKAFNGFYLHLLDVLHIPDRQCGFHDDGIPEISDIPVQNKHTDLMGSFAGQANTGDS